MKTDRIIPGTSLLVSLVCLAGILHVEYRLYEHTIHYQTTRDAEKTTTREFLQDLGQERVEESQHPGHRNRRNSQRSNKNFSSIVLRHHIREELRTILKTEICAKDYKACLQGPKGSRGRRGRRGLPGPRGRMGPRGAIGKHGPRGLQGDRGPKGIKGENGPSGPTGPPGPRGQKGPKGDPADPIEAPAIFVPPKDLVVNESDTARLKCVASGNPLPKVTWSRNSPLPAGRHVIDSNGFLSIKQVTSSDAGRYTCRAISVLGMANASSNLIVQVPPIFISNPKSAIVEESTNVIIKCGASGLPRPTLSWSKSIGDLPKKRTTILPNGSLVINNISKTDGGNYICTAENLLGRASAHAQIMVLPALKFTLRPPAQLGHNLGERVVLNCQATNALGLVWMKDNKPLSVSSIDHSNGTLVIPFLSSKDAGNYVCIARNFHRSIKTTTKVLVINQPMAKSCSELKKKIPRTQSGSYVIDPDGQSGQSSFTVYCDMTDKGGVGVTVVGHDIEARTLVDDCPDSPGSCSQDVRYHGVSMSQLAKLTEISTNCQQFIKFECTGGISFVSDSGYAWWVSRDSVRQNYWGGATPGSKKCACGMTNTCQVTSQGCNCWNGGNGWRSDSGLLTDKSTLPVTQLRFGDTDDSQEQGYHTLGKLKCYGQTE